MHGRNIPITFCGIGTFPFINKNTLHHLRFHKIIQRRSKSVQSAPLERTGPYV